MVNASDISLREGQGRIMKRSVSRVKSTLMLLLRVVKVKRRFIFVTMVNDNHAKHCLAVGKIFLIITRNNTWRMNLINLG